MYCVQFPQTTLNEFEVPTNSVIFPSMLLFSCLSRAIQTRNWVLGVHGCFTLLCFPWFFEKYVEVDTEEELLEGEANAFR